MLGLFPEQVAIDNRNALYGVKAQMQVDSAKFTRRHDGSIDFAALNDIPMFSSLPRSGQEAVLCRLRITIREKNLTSGNIAVFERVKCTTRPASGARCASIGEWLSADSPRAGERQYFLVKFVCHITSNKESPVILVQESVLHQVQVSRRFGYAKERLTLLPSFVMWGSRLEHRNPRPECVLHECSDNDAGQQPCQVENVNCRAWRNGRKRVVIRPRVSHSGPTFFRHPGFHCVHQF